MKSNINNRYRYSRLRVGILASTLATTVGAGYANYVLAAPAPATDATLEEIVVTGSHIVRRDYESNSPIVTVDAAQFESQTGLNVESYLNQLPEYNPAASPVTTQGDVQITPVNSVGIASISLRGFGPNRSLVLVNGKRPTPINALMVTDVNSIPTALLQRVETITGGASAVYGADAVGGVTNFILRDNFEGLEFDSQFGKTDAGDGQETRESLVLGANFADRKGNVVLGLEHYARETALDINRDFWQDRYQDPYAAGTFIFLQGTNGYNCLFNCPNANATNALFPARGANNVFSPISGNFFRGFNFNADGTIFVDTSIAGLTKFKGGNPIVSRTGIAFDGGNPSNTVTMQSLKFNNDQQYTSGPQERYSFFAAGKFRITDKLSAYARATLAESKTSTLLFGTNAIFGWEGLVPYNPTTDSPINPALDYNNPTVLAAIQANPSAYANPGFIATGRPGAQHPVPAELAILLNSRATQNGDWQPNWNPGSSIPNRSTFNTNTQWQVETGLNFDIPVKDWTGELYFSHGQSNAYNNAEGNLSLTRYRSMIRLPDYGRNQTIQGNLTGQSPGFGSAVSKCTSGMYDTFFSGDKPMSADCFALLNAELQTRAQNFQDIVELNVQGGAFKLPAGEVRVAAGYQKRRNKATFVPDILQSTSSFTDQVIGVYPTGYLNASTSVDDYYVEALVPVVSNMKYAKLLELELGARYSDYKQSDSENTWKALVNWQVTDTMRLRGGFNRATRAPNLGELYLNSQQVFTVGGNNFGDPCGVRSISPYGASGTSEDPQLNPGEALAKGVLAAGQTAAGATSTRLICEALMGPTAANQFYNVANAAPGAGAVFNWIYQTGNTSLKSETADTWTFGLVARAPSDNPWLKGLTASLDWYKVEIENAIMLFSVDYANYRCFGATQVTSAAAAAVQAATPACQNLPRNQALGGPLTTTVSYDNQATIATAGFDVTLDWKAQFADLGVKLPGGLGLNLQATVLDYYRTKQSPAVFDVETEWKGSLGPNLSGTQGGSYDYRLFGTLSYFKDNWNVNLRWRYLPEVWSAGYASLQAVKANNAAVSAGAKGILLGYAPTTELETPSYSIFDLSANWNVNDMITLRGGITNLFDKEPVNVASTAGFPIGTNLAGVCQGAVGCQAPGAFSLPTTGAYNGGYYDTLGRRFFVGLKLKF